VVYASSLASAGARETERFCTKAARAIAAVAVIEPHGIAGESKLRRAHRFFNALPQAGLPEDLRTVGTHLSAAAGRPDAARSAHASRRGRHKAAPARRRGPWHAPLFAGPVAAHWRAFHPTCRGAATSWCCCHSNSWQLRIENDPLDHRGARATAFRPPADEAAGTRLYSSCSSIKRSRRSPVEGFKEQDANVQPFVANQIRPCNGARGKRQSRSAGDFPVPPGAAEFSFMTHNPIRKRLAIASFGLQNQVRHALAPAVQLFEQSHQRIVIVRIPLRRNGRMISSRARSVICFSRRSSQVRRTAFPLRPGTRGCAHTARATGHRENSILRH